MAKTNFPLNLEASTLRQIKNLQQLSDAQLDRLAKASTVRTYEKGEIIFDQDDGAKFVYLLLSGVARISYHGYERRTIVSLVPPGEFVGLDSLVPDSNHPFRSDAFEASMIAALKPSAFVEILLATSYEKFLLGFAATLHLNRQSYVHCIRGIGLDVRRRIALELAHLAQHFGSQEARGTAISLAISHETLAGIVGASRQQVTEYLNEFDREKIILREGRRIIINPKRLHKIIDNRP